MKEVAILLENGLFLKGRSFGAKGTAVGEIVFNTSMTGYQEIVTDPSYA
ncbi:MAG: carbamoyl-phosphate synthase domain-containing protein, partial [Campylobacterales bacterium]